MRIAVDATCWHNRRGYGRHARALLRSLVRLDSTNRYTLFLDSPDAEEPLPRACDLRLLQPKAPTVVAASANGHRSMSDMWRMCRALSGREFDLLLFPSIYSYVPTFGRARKLVVIHDVIAETYPALTVPRRSARLFWNAKVRLGRIQADALITVSDYSRACILERFGVDPGRVFVVGEAADPIFRKIERLQPSQKLRSLGIDGSGRMAIYVGGFSPHKNLEALIAAFARIASREEFADVRLVLVGETSRDAFHSYFGTVAAQVKTTGLENRVMFTGYMADDDLVILLNLASVLILPSLMEGFGLPAVEAAACGCPVIATKASPLEGLLNGAGIYIDPNEVEITGALARVLSNPELRERMGRCGVSSAARLTWDHAASQLIEVIQNVASA